MKGAQKISFEGHLDKDTDPAKISKGNYTDAKNIQFITDSTESGESCIPVKGNIEAFDMHSVNLQLKTYRIYTEDKTSSPEAGPATLLFYSNGIQYPLAYTIHWNRSNTVANQGIAISVAANAWPVPNTVVVTNGNNYIDITLYLFFGNDYTISATNGNGNAMVYTVLNEAYGYSLEGELKTIGSYDLLSDLYVWSTPRVNLPNTEIIHLSTITPFVTLDGRTLFQLLFSSPHNLTQGQSITLKDVRYTSASNFNLNTSWIVSFEGFSATTIVIDEYYSNYIIGTLFFGDIQILTNQSGVGEIGVAQYTAETDTWAYTRLLRTRLFNFATKKQCDTYCEENSGRTSIYWTDDFNVPRCLYYVSNYDINGNKLPFVQDGLLSAYNSSALYTYESLNQESRLQLSASGTHISFVQQFQSGGKVESGNWRYAVRFLPNSLTSTEPTDLTNPVPVYLADSGSAYIITGDEPATVTGKINQLLVTDILPGLFKYIELIGVNYVGGAIVGYNIKRESLNSDQTSITLNHTGAETDTTSFDLGLLSQTFTEIVTVRNMDVIDKRMILSNITTRQKIDYSAWGLTFKHSIFKRALDGVRGGIQGTLRTGEYQDVSNVNLFVGYMDNEIYRVGFKVKSKNGGWSDAFYVDDIIINCSATNVDHLGNPTSQYSDPARRVNGLVDFDLTNINSFPNPCDTVYARYIRLENINFDYKIDGVAVRDLIDEISIVRQECIPEVIACGMLAIGVSGTDLSIPAITYPPSEIGEYPYISGMQGTPNTGVAYPSGFTAQRSYGNFYSSDIIFGHTSITYQSSDLVINYGNTASPIFSNGYNSGGKVLGSNFAQYNGVTGVSNPDFVPLNAGVGGVKTTFGTTTNFGTDIFSKYIYFFPSFIPAANNPISPTFCSLAPFFANVSGKPDLGCYYVQYYRRILEKYGNINTGKYVSCGASIKVDSTTPSIINLFVYGGDTFVQNNYFKHRYPLAAANGFGGGISFYSQNRINAQMKMKSISQTGNLYPAISTVSYLESELNVDGNNGEAYQEGYTIRNGVKSDVVFDPAIEQVNDFPARIIWSEIKPQGSTMDNYRSFLVLNYHDLDQANGEIVHHANGNGELLTWQPRAFMRQYFNTRGTLEVKGITEILIGDGSVMSRDGVTVSKLGCKHKWAIVRGKSNGGNDVFYWINTELKKALRFGYDGTVSIGDIKGMQSFLANNLKWVDKKDTPADGEGICGAWDDRFANVLWTVRGKNSTDISGFWNSATSYSANSKVSFGINPFSITGGDDLYQNISGTTSLNQQPDLFPTVWDKLPRDGSVYNQYTLVYNESRNAFTTFTTPTPKIYLKWTDTYLSPNPISPESIIFQHNKGQYCTWYLARTSQAEQAYIEGVVNAEPEETKWAEAIAVDSDITPVRFEFTTKNQTSFLNDVEFEFREDSYYSPIKEDSTVTGINDGNTSLLFGKWIKAKMFFAIDTYQKVSNLIIKFAISTRYKSK